MFHGSSGFFAIFRNPSDDRRENIRAAFSPPARVVAVGKADTSQAWRSSVVVRSFQYFGSGSCLNGALEMYVYVRCTQEGWGKSRANLSFGNNGNVLLARTPEPS